jgi:hypothetical protein
VYLDQHASVQVDGGVRWISSEGIAQFFRTDGGTASSAPALSTDGPCTAYGYPTSMPPANISPISTFCSTAGTITVSGGPTPFTLMPTSLLTPCYDSSLDGGSLPIFTDGASLTISAPGDTAFPAFSLMLTPPEHVDLQVGAVTRGQPLDVKWNAGSGDDLFIYLATFDAMNDRYILCTVPDTGSYTLSASLTSQLLAGAPNAAFLRVEREKQRQAAPASPFVIEVVYASSGVTRDIAYQP